MKKTLAALALATIATAAAAEDWRTQATEAFLADNEGTVVEAMFSQPSSFWISMRDDGSDRSMFADYACMALHNFGMPYGESVTIRIWDAHAMARGELKGIGRGHCKLKPPKN